VDSLFFVIHYRLFTIHYSGHKKRRSRNAPTHSRAIAGRRAVWLTERLWRIAEGLPVRKVAIDDIQELDQNCWFRPGNDPTCRAVARHARKIADADLSYPIILAPDGSLMDGGHRVCKALLLGRTEIDAVRFEVDPEPDYFVSDSGAITTAEAASKK
jgi:hypothetical protein